MIHRTCTSSTKFIRYTIIGSKVFLALRNQSFILLAFINQIITQSVESLFSHFLEINDMYFKNLETSGVCMILVTNVEDRNGLFQL